MIDPPTAPYVVHFDDYAPGLRPQLGGKNAGLGEMTAAGLPVPRGFAVTTEAFETLLAGAGVAREVNDLLRGADPSDPGAVEPISRAVRARIETAPLDAGVAEAIGAGYQRLCDRFGAEDLPVAVRSSATCEDAPEASFAGQHDTFLEVCGRDEVIRHVVRCWSSLWTTRALCYRRRMGYSPATLAMSVGVQKMVRPTAAGVAFTLNPVNGDRSQVAIDANWGLGQTVVAGEVTPDHYLVDKVVFEITRRSVSHKAVEDRMTGATLERIQIAGERASSPCLTDAEIKAVARTARLVERHFGCPQDIEWAIDSGLEPPGNVVLLQARPETVWRRRPRAPLARTSSVLDSIVSTLCSAVQPPPKDESSRREEQPR